MANLALIAFLSYLVGAIPTGVIISKLFRGFDIRTVGSGNMGSTNVFRMLGWKLGVLVQLFDIVKGLVAVLVITHLFDGVMPFNNRTPFEDITVIRIVAGCAAVIGHIWTVFAGFHGGKGINTAAGMLIGVAPIDVSIAVGIFALVLFSSGYVSLGSLAAAAALPTTMCLRYNIFGVDIIGYHTLIFFSIALSLLLIYTHRANVVRLWHGTENRFANLQIFHRK